MADPQRFDTVLRAMVVVVLVAIIGIGGWFGYTVYRDKLIAEDSTPALRIMKVIKAQVAKNPNEAILRVRLGEAYAAAGQPQNAIEQFNAALKIEPKHTGALIDLGVLAQGQNRLDEARAYYQKVIDLTDNTPMEATNDRRETAYYNMGRLEFDAKNYDTAVGDFKAALRIKDDASDTYFYLAESLMQLDQPDDAMNNLAIALKFDPSFAQAHYALGKLYLEKGDKIRASAEIGQAMALSPTAPEPIALAAKIGDPAVFLKTAQAKASSDPKAALEAATIAYNLNNKDLVAGKLEGRLLVQLGHKKAALLQYTGMAKNYPKDAEIAAAVKALSPKSKSGSTTATSAAGI
jgi:tetratricopeptide (TPR) repeat protein